MVHEMFLWRFFPVFAFFSLLQFHAHGFTPTELKEIPPSTSSSLRNLKGWRGFQGLRRQADLRGIHLQDSDQRKVLMMNGTGDDSFIATCYPERGFNSSSYKVVFKSDNQLVLNDSTDITWSHVLGNVASNISVIADFNKFPGNATLTLEVRRLRDESLFDSVSVHFLAAGLVVYRNDTNEILSGAGRSLVINSYKEIYDRPQMDFAVFAQYLNGSSSNTTLTENSSRNDAFRISDIKPVFHCSGQILWDPEFCSITDGTWNRTSTILKRGCGMGFSEDFHSETDVPALHFALYLQKHRAGNCLMVFEWSRFTFNTPFDDEQFTTFLQLEILGNPPAVVRRIQPSNPFRSTGGERLQVEMINTADINVTSFNVHNVKFMLIKGSRRFVTGPDDYFETASFLTMPGSGRSLPWSISGTRDSQKGNSSEPVVFLDETGFRFSYDDDILTLDAITPSTTADAGGDEIILLGNFGKFSSDQEQNNVLFGNFPLDKKFISASSPTKIRLNAPPRTLIGFERLLRITVQVGHSFSNSLNFTYIPSKLELQSYVFGASFDLKKRSYTLSSCGSTSFMVIPENHDASAALYTWNVFEMDNSSVSLLNETSDVHPPDGLDTLEVPNSMFPSYGAVYTVSAEVSIGNLSSSHTFTVEKSRNIVAGVTLIKPESRFMSVPSVHSRIVAKIDIPECFKDPTNLIYEWVYQYKGIQKVGLNNATVDFSGDSTYTETRPERHVFSYENSTGPSDGSLSPIRLGRELVIPQNRLIYGFHTIQLTIRDRTQPRFFGNAITSLTIQKEKLFVRIGNGSFIRTVSDSVPLYLSASSSFDIQETEPDKQDKGLNFSWSCKTSLRANFSNSVRCSDDLLPNGNSTGFTIPSSALQGKTESLKEVEDKVYLRYTVTVQEQSRVAEASQIVVLLKSEGKSVAQSEDVEILNSSGEAIDPTRVKFWEDVIIQPRARPGVKWSFRLDLPYEESPGFLSDDENLITLPGYFTKIGSSGAHFERLPLGILAGKLSPHQRYQFTVVFQQSGKLSAQTSIQFKTIEVPRLLFPPLVGSTGTTDTIFHASAATSFASNGAFVFQFYLMELGNPMSEYCVDGCTGANIVRFSVGKPGHYIFQCRLFAADGRKVIAFKDNSKTIVVTASSSVVTFESIERLIWRDYYLGDDGAVNDRAHYLNETFADIGPASTPENNITANCANITSLWASLASGFVQRDLPNSARARNYVRIAIGCVRIGCFEREETLYDFLRLIDTTISRIPSNEALSISSHEDNADTPELGLAQDLMTFYNLTMSFAISSFASGSSRDRMVATHGEISNIIIDLGELWARHVTVVGANKQVCGWEETYTSPISERLPNIVIRNSSLKAAVGINTMKVAVRCTPEQGTSMKTPFASFDWCDAVYDLTGSERKLITLAETVDFPFLSGIQGGNQTDSARLVSVDISTLGAENALVSALSESMIAAQARETKQVSGSCYRIGMVMKGDVDTRHEEDDYNVPFVMQPRKRFGQILTRPFEGGYYGRRTQGVVVTPGSRNRSDFAEARSNTLGLYGVERAHNRSSLDRFGDTLEGTGFKLVGILIGIIVLILIITLCIFAVVSFVLSNRDPPALETTEAYVDRDFYGRREVRLQVGSTESASVTTERGSGGSLGSRRHVVLDDEDMLGDPIPTSLAVTAPR